MANRTLGRPPFQASDRFAPMTSSPPPVNAPVPTPPLHTRSEFPGTGVGLAIARKVVERHNGSIWAEPRPGGGARFRFDLWAAP